MTKFYFVYAYPSPLTGYESIFGGVGGLFGGFRRTISDFDIAFARNEQTDSGNN
jgi:hypothetical protein